LDAADAHDQIEIIHVHSSGTASTITTKRHGKELHALTRNDPALHNSPGMGVMLIL
jgi:hypothetical protein